VPLGVNRLILSISVARRKIAEAVASALADPLITQDGKFLSLNQSPSDFLLIQQDFETVGDIFFTQDGRTLVTQNNRAILTQRES
jgi:hypothetical protein